MRERRPAPSVPVDNRLRVRELCHDLRRSICTHPASPPPALIRRALVSGCTSTSPPTSTVTVPTCTPEFGGDPYPCTQAERGASPDQGPLHASSLYVYRAYTKLNNQELVHPRRAEPSPELRLFTGGHLASGCQTEVRTQSLASSYAGQLDVLGSGPAPHRSGMPGNVTMITCADYLFGWSPSRMDHHHPLAGARA